MKTTNNPSKDGRLPNTIYLVRHGENLANLTHEFASKNVDYPLTERGIVQAEQTGAYLAKIGIHEVYASPLLRARQTAEIIARSCGLPSTVMDEFKEVQVGSLEGRATPENWALHNEILMAWLRGFTDLAFPGGGDTYEALAGRFVRGIKAVTTGKHGRRIVVVGHGGQFTFALSALCPDVDMRSILSLSMVNCSVSTLETPANDNGSSPRVVEWASFGHMTGGAMEFSPMYPGEKINLERPKQP